MQNGVSIYILRTLSSVQKWGQFLYAIFPVLAIQCILCVYSLIASYTYSCIQLAS